MSKKYLVLLFCCFAFLIAGLLIIMLPRVTAILAKPPATPLPTPNLTTTYSGTLPCADCMSIQEQLTLTKSNQTGSDGTFILQDTYLGNKTKPLIEQGTWVVMQGSANDPNAELIVLNPENPNLVKYYQLVDEATLKMLGKQKQEIQSQVPYTLTKQP